MTDDGPVRVLVAEDVPRIRAALCTLVRSDPGLRLVADAATGSDAVRLARDLRPDVVLMDIQMPGTDGLAAARAILDGTAATRVLVLTTFDTDEYVYEALRIGASGFLLKNAPPEEILRGIRVVHAGHSMLAPEVTGRLIRVFATRPAPATPRRLMPPGVVLSAREIEVAGLVAQGLSNAEIAGELFLSPETVKTYVSRMLAKLGVRDRTQLAVLAVEAGLLRP
ncbi:response regulator transcription factor [Polymorphospora rubra]|uniref:response regulator transcription factor n=1 Tax=Polymorphospora rubra TaxID=338584 RepID=UPI00340CC14A